MVRRRRSGRDFDTLLGRSFGTSKRNFDEIDNAGFKDYLYKRNFDEIDNAGFKDYLYKRNFDEIDNAGFKDYLYKRNFDEIDNAGFKDYLYKRNFDEIDNAGFKDYLYKRSGILKHPQNKMSDEIFHDVAFFKSPPGSFLDLEKDGMNKYLVLRGGSRRKDGEEVRDPEHRLLFRNYGVLFP